MFAMNRLVKNSVGISKRINVPIKSFSTVLDEIINITFIDREGNRATVPARTGTTVLDVAQLHQVDLEGPCSGGGGAPQIRRTENWVEPTYGEGPTCFYCHVQIPSKFNSILPEIPNNEIEGLKGTWDDEYTVTSRLACMITLGKEHDGLVVFVPDAPPTDNL